MQFGLSLGLIPRGGQSFRETLRERDEMMEIADSGGFARLWFLEHHFIPTLSSPAPLIEIAHVAPRTKNTRLGTSVILSPFHNPLLLAEEIALVDHLSDGRLEVGFGRGASVLEANRLGVTSFVESGERQEELLEILFGIWEKDEEFSYAGKYNNFGPTRPVPRPMQLPHPPMWIAGRSVESMRFCAATGVGLMTTAINEPMEHVHAQLKLLDTIVEDIGAPARPPLLHLRTTFVSEDPKDVRAFLDMLTTPADRAELAKKAYSGGTVLTGGPEMDVNPLTVEGLAERYVVGDPETVLKRLREHEAMGFDEFTVGPGGYELGPEWHAKQLRSLRILTEQIIPQFSGKPARAPHTGHRSLKGAFITRDPVAEADVAAAYGLGQEWREWSTDDWLNHMETRAVLGDARYLFVFDANLSPRVKGDVTGYVDTAGTLMLVRGQACPECGRPVLALFHRRQQEGLDDMRAAVRRELDSLNWHTRGHAPQTQRVFT